MKRWLFRLVSALSLLLSVTAGAAWVMSYAQPLDWHLLVTAHSAGLTRLNSLRHDAVFMTPTDGSSVSRFGFWDAWWARSRSGRLTLVGHFVDYDGNLRAIHASPPALIVDLTGPARARAVAFARMPDSHPWARRLGFAWEADAQQVHDDGAGGPAIAKARMVMLPYWFIVLFCLPLPLLWLVNLRARRRAGRRREGDYDA